MSIKNNEVALSGAAEDVLRALFFRGALSSGDLPSKAGAAELRELGLAETRTTDSKYYGEDYLTWLTPAGHEIAIDRTVKLKKESVAVTIMLEFDNCHSPDVNKKISDVAKAFGANITAVHFSNGFCVPETQASLTSIESSLFTNICTQK